MKVAVEDCKRFGLLKQTLISFVRLEEKRHPEIFSGAFSALPLLVGRHIMLLSWDGSRIATVERLLEREEAYGSHEDWANCLASIEEQQRHLTEKRGQTA